LFARVLDGTTDSVALNRIDDGVFLYVNNAFTRTSGYTAEEVLGKAQFEFEFWVDGEELESFSQELIARGSVSDMAARFRCKDGSVNWGELSAEVITIEGETCVLSISRDLTDWRRTEEELRRRETILTAVAFAAERFLESEDWQGPIDEVLAALGQAAGVSRLLLYRNIERAGQLVDWASHEYAAPGVKRVSVPTAAEAATYEGFERWVSVLSSGEVVQGMVSQLPASEATVLRDEGSLSVVAVPVFSGDDWWGYLEFDDCDRAREWSGAEIEALRAAASTLGAVLQRSEVQQRLVEVELTHRALIENIPAVVYLTAPQGQSADLYLSPQYEEFFGVDMEARLGNPEIWQTLTHPDDLPRVLAESTRTQATGDPYRIEYRIKRPGVEGRWKWIRDEAVLLRDASGEPLHWFGVIFDIDDQKRVEGELRETEARYRTLVERVPAITYQELVPSGDYERGSMIYLSPQAQELLGYSLAEFDNNADRFWEAIVHPDDRDIVFKRSLDAIVTRDADQQEYRVITKAGETLWVRDESILVREDSASGTQMWHGVMFDITERKVAEEQLRSTEQRYRQLVEHIPAIVYIDREDADSAMGWRMVYASPQIEQVMGFPAKRWLDEELWVAQLHPDDRERVLSYDAATVKAGESYASEYRMIAEDGRVVWFQEEASVLLEADNTRYWQGVMIDITERKANEAELRQRDAILKATSEAAERFLHAEHPKDVLDEVLGGLLRAARTSRVYIYRKDIDEDGLLTVSMTHERVAPGIASVLDSPRQQGYPLAKEFGRWVERLGSGEVVTGLVREMPETERVILAGQGIHSLLVVPVFVDDEWWGLLGFDECLEERRWSATEIESLRTAAGVLGSAVRRERIERKLGQAEERFRQLVERTPAVVYMDAIDDVSTAMYISPQYEGLLGFTVEERMANVDLWVERLHPEDRDEVVAESRRTNELGVPFAMDYRMVHRDGHTVWVRDEAVVIRDEEGTPRFWQGVLIDITERKRSEEETERALLREREAADQLRVLDEPKNTFLTAVSHDLRTPLAAVLGLALTLEREDLELDEAEARDLARRIASNARKLDRMVVDLLDLDRLSRGVLELKLNRTDVGFLVRKVVDEAEFMGQHPVVVEADPVVAAIDMAKVERIVENLIANASRHTPPGTEVWVRVRDADDGVLIIVDDAGPGVEAELKEAVFEAFRQGKSESSGYSPGVGIGLSLVTRFSQLHHGRAWVQNREGGGASFRVWLPDGAPTNAIDAPTDAAGDETPVDTHHTA